MHESFAIYVGALDPLFHHLVDMPPVKIGELKPPLPERCVYLFSEGDRALYVGRTNHFRRRMRQHSIDAARHNQAVFAFRLARHETGKVRAGYSQESSRAALLAEPEFADAFRRSKHRIRQMDLRFVPVDDPLSQALLEIYTAVVLQTQHNDFDNH